MISWSMCAENSKPTFLLLYLVAKSLLVLLGHREISANFGRKHQISNSVKMRMWMVALGRFEGSDCTRPQQYVDICCIRL
jgi:hypothetical protein